MTARPAPEPTPASKLRDLSRRVRRLGVSGRCDPEQVLLEKLAVAEAIARIARELEGIPSCR